MHKKYLFYSSSIRTVLCFLKTARSPPTGLNLQFSKRTRFVHPLNSAKVNGIRKVTGVPGPGAVRCSGHGEMSEKSPRDS